MHTLHFFHMLMQSHDRKLNVKFISYTKYLVCIVYWFIDYKLSRHVLNWKYCIFLTCRSIQYALRSSFVRGLQINECIGNAVCIQYIYTSIVSISHTLGFNFVLSIRVEYLIQDHHWKDSFKDSDYSLKVGKTKVEKAIATGRVKYELQRAVSCYLSFWIILSMLHSHFYYFLLKSCPLHASWIIISACCTALSVLLKHDIDTTWYNDITKQTLSQEII